MTRASWPLPSVWPLLSVLLLTSGPADAARPTPGIADPLGIAWTRSHQFFASETLPFPTAHRLAPAFADGDRLASWMFPYTSNHDADAEALAAELLNETSFVRSSFTGARADAFFRERLASYLAEIIASVTAEPVLLARLLDNHEDCFAVIDSVAELTSDRPPFAGLDPHAGLANGCNLEVITTLPLWYLAGASAGGPGADLSVPMFLLPTYERYLVQHEFGHMLEANLFDLPVSDAGETLPAAIDRLYAQAQVAPGAFASCYAATNAAEYWAEATALYFSPLPIGSLNGGDGNEPYGGSPCSVGPTPEARAIVKQLGLADISGAALLAALQPDLATLLEAVYGPPPFFSLR
ncbi:MAG: hypothetical protein HYV63_19625 [Candidatus Schekmanbacteria bacterium]|nr:hypothetical protein [Candidatus Schekmanbacteria bacterium]